MYLFIIILLFSVFKIFIMKLFNKYIINIMLISFFNYTYTYFYLHLVQLAKNSVLNNDITSPTSYAEWIDLNDVILKSTKYINKALIIPCIRLST